ncbi:MAG: hypothetical protein GKS06_03590 [Acidobacteria bacterium]|nr:hypothetical protein [Acidobacteriota bacterium]
MLRRARVLPVLALLLLGGGCTFDYFFLAFTVECPYDEDGPLRCYPKNRWNRIRCTTFVSSPFELYAGNYKLEIDIDEAAARLASFPAKMQVALEATDSDGKKVFTFKPKAWKVNKQTGRVEETVKVSKDYVVPTGGQMCIDLKTKGGGELIDGMLMGILWEPLIAREAAN